MPVAAKLVAVAQHKKLPDRCTGCHHQNQHQPVLRVAVGKTVVVAEHREQHRQREVGVVNAALLAALAVQRIDGLAGLDACDDFALAGNDPQQHVGAHGGRQHGADQQKRRTPRKPLARQV